MSIKAQPDHAGLQTDPSNDAPEVVPESRPWGPVERHSSQSKPEYYAPPQSPPQYSTPEAEKSHASPHYDDNLAYPSQGAATDASDGGSRKICGLRRRTFMWLAAAIALIAVIAIVLGAVLGTLLNSDSKSKSWVRWMTLMIESTLTAGRNSSQSSTSNGTASSTSNTTSSISLDSNSGFAATYPVGSSNLYLYYQDEQGRIIENQFVNEKWTIQSDNVPQSSIVAEGVRSGSPLAAISWESNGAVERQVFYLDGNDRVMAANTTNDNTWSPSYQIPETDPAIPDSLALSACVDSKPAGTGLDGIRMDYASSTDNRIEETGMDFFESEENIWHNWTYFARSDPQSGVGCILADNVTHLYLRNATTGAIEQWTWDYYDQYVNSGGGWSVASNNPSTKGRTDIAAATDYEGTDYVFYQDDDGSLVRTLDYGQGLQNLLVIGPALKESRFAATYGSMGGAEASFVMYWTDETPPKAVYQHIDRSGTVLLSGSLG